jgi:hypothetical protein
VTRDDVIRSTAEHIVKVGMHLSAVIHRLALKAVTHDASKWSPEEWPSFEKATPKLADVEYGTPEYKALLQDIRPAVDLHQKRNAHHPESSPEGIAGMTLLDLIEMLCDWKAATERNKDGDILKSLEHARKRWEISDQLYSILLLTVYELDWATAKEES